MKLSAGLIHHYNQLYKQCEVPEGSIAGRFQRRARAILGKRDQYEAVEADTGAPWWIVACIHSLECDLSNNKMPHNGQNLPGPTTIAPKERGPFDTWHDAAVDAIELKLNSTAQGFAWRHIHEALWFLERYNGFGYLLYRPGINTPYLFGLTNIHRRGKYVADGTFDPDAKTNQLGAVGIIKTLVGLEDGPRLAAKRVAGPVNPTSSAAGGYEVSRLQHMLNTMPGTRLKTDGAYGRKSKARFREVFG